MVTLIEKPTIVESVGNKPKAIEEYVGRVNSGHGGVSVARMKSPEGWQEPGQRPEFEEITVVLKGFVRVEYEGGVLDVKAGQAVVATAGRMGSVQLAWAGRGRVHSRLYARVLTRYRPPGRRRVTDRIVPGTKSWMHQTRTDITRKAPDAVYHKRLSSIREDR